MLAGVTVTSQSFPAPAVMPAWPNRSVTLWNGSPTGLPAPSTSCQSTFQPASAAGFWSTGRSGVTCTCTNRSTYGLTGDGETGEAPNTAVPPEPPEEGLFPVVPSLIRA